MKRAVLFCFMFSKTCHIFSRLYLLTLYRVYILLKNFDTIFESVCKLHNTPVLTEIWLLGRIEKVHPSADDLVQLCTCLYYKYCKRPISKFILLLSEGKSVQKV